MQDPIRVCVLDDLEDFLLSIEDLLGQTAQFACAGCFSQPREAMARIPALRPHLTLVDQRMPRLSGIQCIRKLRNACPSTDFVLITAYRDCPALVQEAFLSGARGVLLKPFSKERLFEALLMVAGGGCYIDPEMAGRIAPLQSERAAEQTAQNLLTQKRTGNSFAAARGPLLQADCWKAEHQRTNREQSCHSHSLQAGGPQRH
jgi:two-component system, NarL family, response regulator DevR